MKEPIKFIFYIFIGAICLMTDAFLNGFPIVYSDSSTYIASGLELETPIDRPITYGLFLRFFSLNGLSLWFVIFSQGFILSYLIFLLVRIVSGEKSYLQYGLLTIVLLSLFTGVSWTVSQIIPDIFTPIALLSATLILLGSFQRSTLVILHLLFLISVAMHLSHILLFALLLILIFSFRKFILPKQGYPKRNLHIATLLLLTLVTVITMGSAISKSKQVFFMGAMVEHGIVKTYLTEHCETKHYKLCAYKDSLPERAYDFVWDEDSPLYKIGGWKASKAEFDDIIYGTLTQPKYIFIHIKESIKATLHQLTLFSIGDGNGSFLEGTLLYERVKNYFPNDFKAYTSSKQNQSRLDFLNFLNFLFLTTVVIGFLLIIFLMSKYACHLTRQVKIMALLFLLGILLNAWDCGTFANAIDRLGCKMIWLIPFTTLLLWWNILHIKQQQKQTREETVSTQ